MFGGAYFGQIYFAGQVLWAGAPAPPPPPPVPVEVITLPDHTGGISRRRDEYEWQKLLTEQTRTRALVRNERDMKDIVQLVKLALEELCR